MNQIRRPRYDVLPYHGRFIVGRVEPLVHDESAFCVVGFVDMIRDAEKLAKAHAYKVMYEVSKPGE